MNQRRRDEEGFGHFFNLTKSWSIHSTNSPTAEGAMKALAHIAHRARITAVNFMVRYVVEDTGKVAGEVAGRVC